MVKLRHKLVVCLAVAVLTALPLFSASAMVPEPIDCVLAMAPDMDHHGMHGESMANCDQTSRCHIDCSHGLHAVMEFINSPRMIARCEQIATVPQPIIDVLLAFPIPPPKTPVDAVSRV